MSDIHAKVFEVDKNNLQKTRLQPMIIDSTLAANEVLLKVDSFALTANNISYGIAGDSLGYWRFFETQEPNQWGRIPVMGFAEVMASKSPKISTGERVWGFMPMATHFKIVAGKHTPAGFSDISPHREGLSPVYASFERVSQNPFYNVDNEPYEMLVRGLFTTAWLIDDFMDDNHYFGAQQYLITSASSKTSIALAFAIKERGARPAIAITSEANRNFVTSLGCYQDVVSYQEILTLDASIPSIVVDMAGSQKTLSTIHHHFANQLRYSCQVGVTHHQELNAADLAANSQLPGAEPTFFFAPTQLKKRTSDWGAGKTMQQLNGALLRYIDFCQTTITINHTKGVEQIDGIYQKTLAGRAPASVGQIISL